MGQTVSGDRPASNTRWRSHASAINHAVERNDIIAIFE
jgi:hypothetical protein